jgi:threonylcarbamoyladenosine tRNA methylthiotransferase MtaB
MKRKIGFKTLGCRLNQYETDALVSQFYRQGYEVVDFRDPADAYVINTCTVTSQSDHKSRNLIRQASRRKDGALVVVTGCMADHYKSKLENLDHIHYVVENDKKSSVFNLIDGHFKGEIRAPGSFEKDVFGFGIADYGFHTRAMIKIQDGCDNFCSFCIVPKVRGRAVSRPSEDILSNIKKVLEAGFKEIVLTGVNIGRYHYERLNFERLVRHILDIEGEFRIRISSIEPDGFSHQFFDLFQHPKLTPHLHLCLQSGSEKILLKMRRMYTVRGFREMVEILKSRYPDFNLTTDIIVGFPGETAADFNKTTAVVKEIGFSHVHTFKYSIRHGTKAARLDDQVSENIKNERSEIIRNISRENRIRYFTNMLQKQQILLTERTRKKESRGYGEHYIPIRMDQEDLPNRFIRVKLTGIVHDEDPEMTAVAD